MDINFKNKMVGRVIGDTYFTWRKPEHFMKKYCGFGISDKVLKILSNINVKTIVFTYFGKKTEKYSCDIKQFLDSDKTHEDIDNDLQKFVSVRDMSCSIDEKGGTEIQMENKTKTIKDFAQDYEPMQTLNIADLDVVNTDTEIRKETFKEGTPEEFTINVATIGEKEYRVPATVLKDLKQILAIKPDLKTFNVSKSGSGMSTSYTVIPLV